MEAAQGESNEFQRHGKIDAADPHRCQGVCRSGQCPFPAVIGGKYCICHGGVSELRKIEKNNIHSYRLAQYQARVDALTDSPTIKSLRDEIAIVRFLVQKQLDACNGDITSIGSIIAMLVATIESLVISCTKVENTLKDFIDHENAFELAQNLMSIVRVEAPASMQAIADDFLDLLTGLQSVVSETKISQYKVNKWQSELLTFLSSEKLHSLRGEIGVMRIIIEEQLNSCTTPMQLVYQARPIMSNIQKVEKLVVSCNRIEQSMGLLLDESAAVAFGQQLVSIITEHVKNGPVIERIVARMSMG